MSESSHQFVSKIPDLDMSEGTEMLTDFSREAQRHLISARNSLLVLETMPSDPESIENVFKTFHTIRGLADFLNLNDISTLTNCAEQMIDLTRKNILNFDGEVARLAGQAIEFLQKLLELLDEQISNGGKLKSPYLCVGELVQAINQILKSEKSDTQDLKRKIQAIPTIQYIPDMTTYAMMEKLTLTTDTELSVDKDDLKKLLKDYYETMKELKDVQGKLQERQRELIKERELAIKLTDRAQKEARSKSEYLANMSHEIRTLINAILGFTELLKDDALSDKQREHINTIILSGKMLLGIVNDILDFSKVEAGKLKLESIDFNLPHIIEEVFKIIRTRLDQKPINLYFKIADNVNCSLKGDPTRLKQIFINLIDNAIKFTESGEIGLSVEKNEGQTVLKGENALHFKIQDSGIGIPEDRKHAIFESFTQAETSTTRRFGGTGLGLTLCKTFVENMHGRIWVESEVGKGSAFHFTIKLADGQTKPKDYNFQPLKPFEGIDVMVVEGYESSVKIYNEFFKQAGLNMLPFTSRAKQASEFLIKYEQDNKDVPALIFIDTLLPDKEGFMLAYKIKQQPQFQSIKLVAVSSNVKTESSDDFQQAGFDAFLAKPLIYDELVDLILRLLGDHRAPLRVITHEMIDTISCAGIRVLVVEDSAPNQELLKVHFGTLGCICDYVSNGKQAVESFKTGEYDICFMDLQMPVMGGLEASRIIRNELRSSVPIVALTAAEIQEEKEKCLAAGMTDYLAKPFDMEQLKEKIIRCTKM